jgi:hypothetical protein
MMPAQRDVFEPPGRLTLDERHSQMVENAELALLLDELPRPVLLYSGG